MMRSLGGKDRLAITRKVYLYSCMLVSALIALWGFVLSTAEFLSVLQNAGGLEFLLFDLGRAIGFILVGVGVFLYYRMVFRSHSRFA
jgi:hypothetical protein